MSELTAINLSTIANGVVQDSNPYISQNYTGGSITIVEGTYQENLKEFEKSWLKRTMHATKYNQSRAAIKMGWSRGTLRTKLKEHFGDEYFRDSE